MGGAGAGTSAGSATAGLLAPMTAKRRADATSLEVTPRPRHAGLTERTASLTCGGQEARSRDDAGQIAVAPHFLLYCYRGLKR